LNSYPPAGDAVLKYIRTEYIKDVSAGNTNYERGLMQKFLRTLPMELQELENALKNENVEKLKRIAHNLKTTISVMGLNELLNPLLDEIELVDAGWPRYREIIEKLIDYCNKAIAETKEFLITS
jgi:HPt (histidine-containing phosphotransfer) domain-containing protein